MRLSNTLSLYLARQYLFWIGSVFFGLIAVALVFDVVEMLRRGQGKEEATVGILIQMSFLKLPNLVETLLPFVVLFGSMLAFWRLARMNEVVVVRAAGVSVWQFLLPAVVLTILIGMFHITVFNPFASVLLSKYEQLETKLLKRSTSLLNVSSNGLWLRQADDRGQSVIHALRVGQSSMVLHEVIIFLYEGNDHFVGRIDADTARLHQGYWDIEQAWLSAPDRATQYVETYRLPTDLTVTQIQESFASPKTMSFWQLPQFVATLEAAGFSGHRHRLHYLTLLAYPVLLCSMVIIAATFTLRVNRRSGAAFAVMGGVIFSFVLYFLSDVVQALGLSASVPILLAAWTPTGVTAMLGIALLLHLEDG